MIYYVNIESYFQNVFTFFVNMLGESGSTKVKEILVNKTEKTLYEKLLKVREAFKRSSTMKWVEIK